MTTLEELFGTVNISNQSNNTTGGNTMNTTNNTTKGTETKKEFVKYITEKQKETIIDLVAQTNLLYGTNLKASHIIMSVQLREEASKIIEQLISKVNAKKPKGKSAPTENQIKYIKDLVEKLNELYVASGNAQTPVNNILTVCTTFDEASAMIEALKKRIEKERATTKQSFLDVLNSL